MYSEDEVITIQEKLYDFLLNRHILLKKLEAAGVDNWEGYPGLSEEEEDD